MSDVDSLSLSNEQALQETLDVISSCSNYNAWLLSYIIPYLRGRVLDIGSGTGNLVRHFDIPIVDQVVVTDFYPGMVDQLKGIFKGNPKFSSLQLDIENGTAGAERYKNYFDVITCCNVLEHIPEDVQALRHMLEFLKPDGKLVILVPALPLIHGTLDDLVGHSRRYTRRSLISAAEKAGGTAQKIHYFNLLGIITWFLSGKVFRSQSFSVSGCRFLDHVVPFLRFLESGFNPPLGQSLVCIIQHKVD